MNLDNIGDIGKPLETLEVTDEEGNDQRDAKFIDFDTLVDISDNRYRLRGIDAPEVWGTYSGILAPAKVGAQELTTQAAILANHYGFNRIVKTGEKDREREIIDLANKSGQNLSDFAVEERLAGANRNTSNEVLTNRMLNRFFDEIRLVTDPAEAGNRSRAIINEAIRDADMPPVWAEEAINEEEYALAQRIYSHNEMGALGEALKKETDPDKRQRLQDALYHAKTTSNPYSYVEKRQSDRNINNEAYDQFSTSLSLGLEHTVQSLYGLGEMIGEEAGWEWLAKKGSAGISRSEDEQEKYGTVLTQMSQMDGSTGDAFTWLTNNVAMSIPFMAAAIGGGLLTAPLGGAAALGTAGALAVGAIPSTILTTGSIWNSMPEGEKNAALAVAGGFAVGLLDRFGFSGVPKTLTTASSAVNSGSMKDLFKSIQNDVLEQLVKQGNFTPEAALVQVMTASRSQLVKMADDYGKFASKNLRELKLTKDVIRKIAGATTREAATETVQTAIEEVAAVHGTSVELDPERFKEALITSAIVGGVFGSTFTLPSVAKSYSDRQNILYDAAESNKEAELYDQIAKEESTEYVNGELVVRDMNVDIALEEIKKYGSEGGITDEQKAAGQVDESKTFQERNKEGRTARSAEGMFKRAFNNMVKTPSGLWAPHLITMLKKIGFKNEDGTTNLLTARLSAIFSGTGIISGLTHQQYIQHTRGQLQKYIPSPDAVAAALGTNVRNANKIVRKAIETIQSGAEYTGPKAEQVYGLLETYKNNQVILKAKLKELGLTDEADLLKGDYDLLTNRGLEQSLIKADRDGFKAILMDSVNGFGMGSRVADGYISRLLSNNEVATEAAKELANKTNAPAGVLSAYMNKNVLGSYRDGLANTAKLIGDTKYLGKNKELLTNVLNKMVRSGEINNAQANELASDLNDYLEIANGEYGAWDSPWIKSVQDNLILMTFLRGMGFSALASWPELGLTQLGVPEHIAFKHMNEHAREASKSFAEYINFMASVIPGSPIPRKIYTKAEYEQMKDPNAKPIPNNLLEELGFKGVSGSAVRQQGIEISSWQQTVANNYAKAVGLNNITDYTRGVRAAMASDVIAYYANVLAMDGDATSNMAREAYSELRSLGVDIDFMVGLHAGWRSNPDGGFDASPQGQKDLDRFKRNIEIGTLRFVDQAIVNPLPGQVPKGYKHQKLAIFNQFQGFIANFTATVLPRILRQVTSGSPGVTTNALTVALTMMAAAMFATMLRDEIKYGETTPYLDDYDKFRRVVFASGLLGTGERVLQGMSPLYGRRSAIPTGGNPVTESLSRSIDGLLGESAAYGLVTDALGSAFEFGFGDNEKGVKKAVKMLPMAGSINQANQSITDFLRGE